MNMKAKLIHKQCSYVGLVLSVTFLGRDNASVFASQTISANLVYANMALIFPKFNQGLECYFKL